MSILIFIAKLFASLFLFAFLVAGIFKANPRTHNPKYGHAVEYITGFLIFTASLAGFYYLWIA